MIFEYNFISVDILFSIAFLNLVACLVVNNNSQGKLFPLNISIHILLTVDFNLFSCESDNLTFTLFYSTIYIFYKTFVVPL